MELIKPATDACSSSWRITKGKRSSQKLGGGQLSLRQANGLDLPDRSGACGGARAQYRASRYQAIQHIVTKDNSARIVDFGLARVVATPSATMTGGTTGTLPYMSPEQILGEAVDQRCDVSGTVDSASGNW